MLTDVPRDGPSAQSGGLTMGRGLETRFAPSRRPAPWAVGLPTCLGPSGPHRSLCSWPCTSGRVPAGPGRKALWENATGWLSRLAGVPAGCCAVWEERESFFNLTKRPGFPNCTAERKSRCQFSLMAHTSHEPSSQSEYIQ